MESNEDRVFPDIEVSVSMDTTEIPQKSTVAVLCNRFTDIQLSWADDAIRRPECNPPRIIITIIL